MTAGGAFGAWAIALVAVLGGLAAGRVNGGMAAIVVGVLLVFVAKRALKADKRDDAVRRLTNRLVSRHGTRLAGADLTRANFTSHFSFRPTCLGPPLVPRGTKARPSWSTTG